MQQYNDWSIEKYIMRMTRMLRLSLMGIACLIFPISLLANPGSRELETLRRQIAKLNAEKRSLIVAEKKLPRLQKEGQEWDRQCRAYIAQYPVTEEQITYMLDNTSVEFESGLYAYLQSVKDGLKDKSKTGKRKARQPKPKGDKGGRTMDGDGKGSIQDGKKPVDASDSGKVLTDDDGKE